MTTLPERIAAVRDRIARAAARAGRSAADVTLVAVSKTFPAEDVRAAFAAGLRRFGENRVQEAERKIEALADLRSQGLTWDLVGHLQANKARKAMALFDRIQSVDDADLGARVGRIAVELGREMPVLMEVDLAGEATKFGLPEARLFETLEILRRVSRLRVEGLMVVPPYADDPEHVRPFFRRLRELRDRGAAQGLLRGRELSMGMSHDLEIAIEEGATIVRVGTAIFGGRPAQV